MSRAEIENYLEGVPEPQRSTLREVHLRIEKLLPSAEQCISYGMPAFRVNGKVLAGFASFKNHCAYLPHSGSVISKVELVSSYEQTLGSLHFPIDKPLDVKILRELIRVRRIEAFGE